MTPKNISREDRKETNRKNLQESVCLKANPYQTQHIHEGMIFLLSYFSSLLDRI
jgi:hypothetical protein